MTQVLDLAETNTYNKKKSKSTKTNTTSEQWPHLTKINSENNKLINRKLMKQNPSTIHQNRTYWTSKTSDSTAGLQTHYCLSTKTNSASDSETTTTTQQWQTRNSTEQPNSATTKSTTGLNAKQNTYSKTQYKTRDSAKKTTL